MDPNTGVQETGSGAKLGTLLTDLKAINRKLAKCRKVNRLSKTWRVRTAMG